MTRIVCPEITSEPSAEDCGTSRRSVAAHRVYVIDSLEQPPPDSVGNSGKSLENVLPWTAFGNDLRKKDR